MESRIKTLLDHSGQLFSKRLPLVSLWQEIAYNFYPERADFTIQRSIGQDFAANPITSYPLLARRDLGNAFSSMLRPNDRDWFFMHTNRQDREDNSARRWLEWATGTMRRAMYARPTQFVRSTKEADHDFAAFGQCAISVELNRDFNELLYRCWHLRDVAWSETYDGKVMPVYRKWKPTAIELADAFPGKVSEKVKTLLEKSPFEQVECMHALVDARHYDLPKKTRAPYVSIHFECDTGAILEESPTFNKTYVIPRWQTVSGYQYAYSPATVAALPDSRLIQAMTLTLLEASEKAANPPIIATQDVVRSDMQVFAGGITWVDAEYDERLGEALRPMTIDSRNLPLGRDIRNDVKEMIAEAFFLNKLNLPPAGGPDMTAYEVGQRIQEYIRNALPLFEPMELEYNGALCELTFEVLLRAGAFGNPQDIPQSIRGTEIQFRFESPLHQAVERQKGQTFNEMLATVAEAIKLDPSAAYLPDVKTALRDTLEGIGVQAKWVNDPQMVDQMAQHAQAQQQTQQLIADLQAGGDAAQSIGKAGQSLGLTAAPPNTKAA